MLTEVDKEADSQLNSDIRVGDAAAYLHLLGDEREAFWSWRAAPGGFPAVQHVLPGDDEDIDRIIEGCTCCGRSLVHSALASFVSGALYLRLPGVVALVLLLFMHC